MPTIKALSKLKPQEGIWLTEVPMPEIGPNDVLIKIKKTAICGTDIHIYNWDDWAQSTIKTPMIAGHEFVGIIDKIGSQVTELSVGQRVSAEGHITCGFCRNCRSGTEHLCKNTIGTGVNRDGAFTEYLSMPARNVFPIPDSISDNEAAIFDPYGNAAHTALSFDLVGEDVLVTGAGPIGIMGAAIAKYAGARYVVITDINEHRLDLARKMGIDLAFNPNNTDLFKVMKDLGMTEGFDVGMEMSGSPAAFNSILDTTCNGANIALLGILPKDTQIDWNKVIFKGLFIKGIYGREMFETWHKMTAMLQSGLDLKPVITHEFNIEDFQQGFDAMRSGESGKVILNW